MAFPPPPEYFKQYTEENLLQLEEWKAGSLKDDTRDAFFRSLQPPPVIAQGRYTAFGRSWPVEDKLDSLEDSNVRQLYPKGECDRVQELKKLNRSVLFGFTELIACLVQDSNSVAEHLEHIRLMFINMHHLINEYRPHQARETLRMLMQEQLDRKRRLTDEANSVSDQVRNLLKNLLPEREVST